MASYGMQFHEHEIYMLNAAPEICSSIDLNSSTLPCLHQVDVLTVEIEHVDVDALETAAAQFSLDVEPTPHTLRLIQVPHLCTSCA